MKIGFKKLGSRFSWVTPVMERFSLDLPQAAGGNVPWWWDVGGMWDLWSQADLFIIVNTIIILVLWRPCLMYGYLQSLFLARLSGGPGLWCLMGGGGGSQVNFISYYCRCFSDLPYVQIFVLSLVVVFLVLIIFTSSRKQKDILRCCLISLMARPLITGF